MPRSLKVTLWIIGGLIGAFLVLGIIGAILEATGVIEEEEAAPTPTTTTTTTTTVLPATTTTLPPTTTTEAPMTEEECGLWALTEAEWTERASEAVRASGAWLAVGDLAMAESEYWHAKGLYETIYFDAWLAECGHWDPEEAADAAASYAEMMATWEEVQSICRVELEPLGFAC